MKSGIRCLKDAENSSSIFAKKPGKCRDIKSLAELVNFLTY